MSTSIIKRVLSPTFSLSQPEIPPTDPTRTSSEKILEQLFNTEVDRRLPLTVRLTENHQLVHSVALRNRLKVASPQQCEEILDIFRNNGDHRNLITTLLQRCSSSCKRMDFYSAVRNYEEALRYCNDQSPELFNKISKLFKTAFEDLNNLRNSLKNPFTEHHFIIVKPLEDMLALRAELNKEFWADGYFWMMASFLYKAAPIDSKNIYKAIEAAKSGLNLLDLYSSGLELASYYKYLGDLHTSKKQHHEAIKNYTEALYRLSTIVQNEMDQNVDLTNLESIAAQIVVSLAAAHRMVNEFSEAITCCVESAKIFYKTIFTPVDSVWASVEQQLSEAKKDLTNAVLPLIKKGNEEIEQQNYAGAMTVLVRADKLLRSHRRILGQEESTQFEKNLDLSIQGMKRQIERNLVLCHNRCDDQNWEEALLYFAKAFEDWNSYMLDRGTHYKTFKNVAKKMEKAKLTADSGIKKALEHCITLIELDDIYHQTVESEVAGWHHLATLYLFLKKHDEALQNYQLAQTRIDDCIASEATIAFKEQITQGLTLTSADLQISLFEQGEFFIKNTSYLAAIKVLEMAMQVEAVHPCKNEITSHIQSSLKKAQELRAELLAATALTAIEEDESR